MPAVRQFGQRHRRSAADTVTSAHGQVIRSKILCRLGAIRGAAKIVANGRNAPPQTIGQAEQEWARSELLAARQARPPTPVAASVAAVRRASRHGPMDPCE